jgi:hypothetical protein
MKRLAYSLLLFLALPAASGFAQGRFIFGIAAGAEAATGYHVPSDSKSKSYYSKPQITEAGGIEIGYFIPDLFSISAKGLLDLSVNFIEIPVTVKIPIPSALNTYFFAGPMVTIFLGSNTLNDIALYGGFGVALPLSKGADFYIDLGLSIGFINVSTPAPEFIDDPIGFNSPFYKIYSRELHLNFGFLFGK